MLFSILIPVRNDRENLIRCLSGFKGQDLGDCEILVCDDGSDPPLTLGEIRPLGLKVQLFRLEGRGPGAARNFLSKLAKGKFLFFLDADVEPLPSTLACARRILSEHPEIKAFFGSYDDSPYHSSLVSTYKNLFHHYIHQRSNIKVSSFWCGCGVILRRLYLECGGLSEFYQRPCIEDIELGTRLTQQGMTIHLFKQLQVKHLKRWTLSVWLYSDLFCRGIPWVRLMRSSHNWDNVLNFTWGERLSALAGLAFTTSVAGSLLWSWSAALALISLAAFVYLNYDFLSLVAAKRALTGAIAVVPLHLVYSIVCVISLVAGNLYPPLRLVDSIASRKILTDKHS